MTANQKQNAYCIRHILYGGTTANESNSHKYFFLEGSSFDYHEIQPSSLPILCELTVLLPKVCSLSSLPILKLESTQTDKTLFYIFIETSAH